MKKPHARLVSRRLVRLVPTAALFRCLWRGFLNLLSEEWAEPAAALYFRDVFDPDAEVQPGGWETAAWWSGFQNLVPGTASGTQAVESFHRTWAARTYV